jgi:hypothetical protein
MFPSSGERRKTPTLLGLLERANPNHLNREKINAYRILVGKPQGKTPLGRRRFKWV